MDITQKIKTLNQISNWNEQCTAMHIWTHSEVLKSIVTPQLQPLSRYIRPVLKQRAKATMASSPCAA